MLFAVEIGDDLKGSKDKIHARLGFAQVLWERKEDKLMAEKEKVHGLKIHKMLFAVEMGVD